MWCQKTRLARKPRPVSHSAKGKGREDKPHWLRWPKTLQPCQNVATRIFCTLGKKTLVGLLHLPHFGTVCFPNILFYELQVLCVEPLQDKHPKWCGLWFLSVPCKWHYTRSNSTSSVCYILHTQQCHFRCKSIIAQPRHQSNCQLIFFSFFFCYLSTTPQLFVCYYSCTGLMNNNHASYSSIYCLFDLSQEIWFS